MFIIKGPQQNNKKWYISKSSIKNQIQVYQNTKMRPVLLI